MPRAKQFVRTRVKRFSLRQQNTENSTDLENSASEVTSNMHRFQNRRERGGQRNSQNEAVFHSLDMDDADKQSVHEQPSDVPPEDNVFQPVSLVSGNMGPQRSEDLRNVLSSQTHGNLNQDPQNENTLPSDIPPVASENQFPTDALRELFNRGIVPPDFRSLGMGPIIGSNTGSATGSGASGSHDFPDFDNDDQYMAHVLTNMRNNTLVQPQAGLDPLATVASSSSVATNTISGDTRPDRPHPTGSTQKTSNVQASTQGLGNAGLSNKTNEFSAKLLFLKAQTDMRHRVMGVRS